MASAPTQVSVVWCLTLNVHIAALQSALIPNWYCVVMYSAVIMFVAAGYCDGSCWWLQSRGCRTVLWTAWRIVDFWRSALLRRVAQSACSQSALQPSHLRHGRRPAVRHIQRDAARPGESHVIRRRPGRPTPWFGAHCRQQRRECRRLELHCTARTCRPDDRRRWVKATRRPFSVYRSKKDEWWSNLLLQCDRSSAALWRSMSSVLGRRRDVNATTSHTAQGFADLFTKKIYNIRSATSGLALPPVTTRASSSLSCFYDCPQHVFVWS